MPWMHAASRAEHLRTTRPADILTKRAATGVIDAKSTVNKTSSAAGKRAERPGRASVQFHYRMTDDADRIEALRCLRSTLKWLGDDVHYIRNEVDPIVEMCTITKAFDNS